MNILSSRLAPEIVSVGIDMAALAPPPARARG